MQATLDSASDPRRSYLASDFVVLVLVLSETVLVIVVDLRQS